MQRLIDANEILKEDHQHYDYWSDEFYVTVRDIENAPTVEAIPIEWIKEWANNYCDWSQEKLIECLLRTWNKNRRGEKEDG